MTEQTAQPETASRSLWTTALIAAFGGPFGGFLWIGAGRLAVISLLAVSAVSIALCYIGFPVMPGVDLAAVGAYSSYGLMLVWAALVVPFARRFKPDKWYAQGVSVFVLAFYASVVAAFVVRTFLFQSFPPDPSFDYVKRVVGLPGDKIQMVDGVLRINGVAVKLEDVGPYTSEDFPQGARLQRETLPNGVSYSVISLTDTSVTDNTRVFEVPEGHYFVLGDNRDNSSDSRLSVGFVPAENLVGKAVRLFWNSQGTEYSSRQRLDAPAGQ